MTQPVIKDSGNRREFDNWFVRDLDDDKLRWDLMPIEQMSDVCLQYTLWMKKYWENNWHQARWKVAINRFKQSARRHFLAWQSGQYDEMHHAATVFNIWAYEFHTKRMRDEWLTFDKEWNEVLNNK